MKKEKLENCHCLWLLCDNKMSNASLLWRGGLKRKIMSKIYVINGYEYTEEELEAIEALFIGDGNLPRKEDEK